MFEEIDYKREGSVLTVLYKQIKPGYVFSFVKVFTASLSRDFTRPQLPSSSSKSN